MRKKTDFDKLRREFEQHAGKLQANAHNTLAQLRLSKRHAFQMAARYLGMLQQHQPLLLEWCKEQGFTGKDPFDKLRDRWFAPVELLGVDAGELIHAAQGGMSEKEFLSKGISAWVSTRARQHRRENSIADRPLPAAPNEALPVPEQLKMWKVRAETAEVQCRELKRQVRELDHCNARIERELARIKKSVEAVDSAMCSSQTVR